MGFYEYCMVSHTRDRIDDVRGNGHNPDVIGLLSTNLVLMEREFVAIFAPFWQQAAIW